MKKKVTRKKPVRLPTKQSALLRLAVHDAMLVEKDPRYALDMNVFHAPIQGACAVCLAGAVMSKTLKADRKLNLWPHQFSAAQQDALLRIDSMRAGSFRADNFDRQGATIGAARAIIESSTRDHRAPWSVYLGVADALELVGL